MEESNHVKLNTEQYKELSAANNTSIQWKMYHKRPLISTIASS